MKNTFYFILKAFQAPLSFCFSHVEKKTSLEK